MRNAIIYSLAIALAIGRAAVASADESCSNRTLDGSYILSANGVDANKTPIAEAGMVVYDGAGNILFKAKYASNLEVSLIGTYKVAKNCRGEVIYQGGRTVTLFIAPSGDEYSWVVTSGPILAGNARRVSKNDLITIKP